MENNNTQEPRAPANNVEENNDVDDVSNNVDAILLKSTLSRNITQYRQNLGLSRAALAKAIGVTEMSLGQYERGARTPSIEKICKLADVLNVSTDSLFGRVPPLTYNTVEEYRLEKVFLFLRGLGLIILGSPEVGWKIKAAEGNGFSYTRTEDGAIVLTKYKNVDFKTLKFKDLETLITFVETIISNIINASGVGYYMWNVALGFSDWAGIPNCKLELAVDGEIVHDEDL